MIVTKCENCYFYKDDVCGFDIPQTLLHNFPMVFSSKNIQNNVIYNFYCPYARTSEWVAQKKEIVDESGIVKEILESRPTISFIYFIDNNWDNFTTNLSILKNIKYDYIYFVIKNSFDINKSQYIEFIENNEFQNWKLHAILEDEMTESEIIDMILSSTSIKTDLIYTINNKYEILLDSIDTVLNTFNLLRYHKVVFLPNDIFSFHNIVIPMNLWSNTHERFGLALSSLEEDNETIRLTLQ
jgi:hypothetical protein